MLKSYFASIISVTLLWEKGRNWIRIWIRTSDKRIRKLEAQKHANPADPSPQHCLLPTWEIQDKTQIFFFIYIFKAIFKTLILEIFLYFLCDIFNFTSSTKTTQKQVNSRENIFRLQRSPWDRWRSAVPGSPAHGGSAPGWGSGGDGFPLVGWST